MKAGINLAGRNINNLRYADDTTLMGDHALEKEMAPHSSVLAWRIPGTGKPGGLQSMGSPGSPALQEDSLPAKLPGSPELLRYRSLVLITGQGAANDFILLFSMDTISEQNYSIHNGAIQWPPHCILISLALSPSSLYFKVFLQPSALLKPPC